MSWEAFHWQNLSPQPIVGVDEVGRGCLAGPVLAGAAILDLDHDISYLTDSKLLSASRREVYSERIKAEHRVALGFATVAEIEELNILQATFLAMRRALEGLGLTAAHVLVDGNMIIPGLAESFKQTPVVKGDLRAAPIAAASIVAKVARDQLLKDLGERYPQYGFEAHKGYGTSAHKDAIKRFGPCPEHRRSFGGVREHLNQTC